MLIIYVAQLYIIYIGLDNGKKSGQFQLFSGMTSSREPLIGNVSIYSANELTGAATELLDDEEE